MKTKIRIEDLKKIFVESSNACKCQFDQINRSLNERTNIDQHEWLHHIYFREILIQFDTLTNKRRSVKETTLNDERQTERRNETVN